MISVKIIFLSLLPEIIGVQELIYSTEENSTVENILIMLRKDYGKTIEQTIYDSSGKPNKYIIIALNGEDIRFLNSIQTPLHEGDEILFLPRIAGG